ncbi:MAG: hypothetical protein IJW58_04170 [Clostridia bacterium]|nr:hypothetical protein [Clostridia bacterium]
MEKEIYIVLTQSGTWMSRFLRLFTKTTYNHSSISLENDLTDMYSFARKYKYYPFIGGLVREYPDQGVFGRFPETQAMIFGLTVPTEKYNLLKAHIDEMYANRRRWHYNFIGVFLAWFGKSWDRKRCFYCSEFIKDLLIRFDLFPKDVFPRAVRPLDFSKLFESDLIYQGNLLDYARTMETLKKEETSVHIEDKVV